MYRKLSFVLLVLIMITTSLLVACSTSTTIPSSATTPVMQTTKPVASTTQPTATTTASVTTSATTTTTVTKSNWWDELGEPKYGGKMVWRVEDFPKNFDPYNYVNLVGYPFEGLFMRDWTVDRNIWSFRSEWTPEAYWTGCLAKSWEWPDAQTLIIHVREGVYWQNKPPVNGREFTADDMEYHFDRVLGTGHGFTVPDPWYKGWIAGWKKATATDKYTLKFEFKNPTIVINHMSLFEPPTQSITAPEAIEKGIKTWEDVVGTGPWILKEFVDGSSLTLEKNPNYWGFDERHPENRIPYMDAVTVLCILDASTSVAAIRTGKIDYIDRQNWKQAKTLMESNPELDHTSFYDRNFILELRCDKTPFTDINVRKALQMSLDRPLIAKTHYGGLVDGKPAGIMSPEYKGYVIPYDEWPQTTKDEYTYNPQKAKALLADAGYPTGFNTNVVAINSMDQELLQIIKSNFKDIGVELEIKTMDFPTAFAFVKAGKHDQMFMWISMAGVPPLVAMENGLSNTTFTHHNDLAYDAIVEKFRKASSVEEAQLICKEADMYFIQQHWRVEIFPGVTYIFWQPRIKGFSGDLGADAKTWARLWLDQK